MNTSPFHVGELQVQERLGVREEIGPWARKVVRSYLPDQHREFFSQLPFLVAAAYDDNQQPWVTLLTGSPGFVSSPNETTLAINATPFHGDALEGAFQKGDDIGLLGIELEARRRNRVNGKVAHTLPGQIQLGVTQSFGNCPQYISSRKWAAVELPESTKPAVQVEKLSDTMKKWISEADTFFIASGFNAKQEGEANGLDASHRGGEAGFVEVLNSNTLLFPDYAGNNHFNTIGNLSVDSRVGLLFIDFAQGSLLQITGRAALDWNSEEVSKRPGAQRLVEVEIEKIILLEAVLPLRWGFPSELARAMIVGKKQQETEEVTSFLLLPKDGGSLPAFKAGQSLPIEVQADTEIETAQTAEIDAARVETGKVRRNYSISSPPDNSYYRISVKREKMGVMSRFLHDRIQEGDSINVESPTGDFVLDFANKSKHQKPVVLIGAGIGVTPLMSMLHQLIHKSSDRPIYFFHGVRNGKLHCFTDEVHTLAEQNQNVSLFFAYSQPLPEDDLKTLYHKEGRLDSQTVVSTLASALPSLDADYYLCGPSLFLSGLVDGLQKSGVAEESIHTETFSSS